MRYWLIGTIGGIAMGLIISSWLSHAQVDFLLFNQAAQVTEEPGRPSLETILGFSQDAEANASNPTTKFVQGLREVYGENNLQIIRSQEVLAIIGELEGTEVVTRIVYKFKDGRSTCYIHSDSNSISCVK